MFVVGVQVCEAEYVPEPVTVAVPAPDAIADA
jgi:hypothetical protein